VEEKQIQMFTRTSKAPPTRAFLAFCTLLLALIACDVQLTDATPTTGAGGACDDAAFVTDVTIPDGTTVKAAQPFTKTWRMSNTGTCTWSAGYRLAFVGGDAMGGTSALLGKSVPPGAQADISVTMTAPSANGSYRGNWRMHNGSNQAFGSTVYVVVKVADAGGTPAPTSPSTGCPSGNFRVSGNLNITDGVIFTFTNATSTPGVIFVEQGYYFCVPSGWSGTWTPSKGAAGNWTFTPQSYSQTVTSDLTGYHFVATPLIGTTAGP
jgi:hypothetical protein